MKEAHISQTLSKTMRLSSLSAIQRMVCRVARRQARGCTVSLIRPRGVVLEADLRGLTIWIRLQSLILPVIMDIFVRNLLVLPTIKMFL
jgi:hypothetical protein